ncbi:MAG: hypothetical protein WAO19_04685 [Candidatus Kryptoniota bacterium]
MEKVEALASEQLKQYKVLFFNPAESVLAFAVKGAREVSKQKKNKGYKVKVHTRQLRVPKK